MFLRFCRHVATAAFLLTGAGLHGQENWDSAFKLVGAELIGAKDGRLGSSANWAIALEGSYPIFSKGSLVFEGGYRTLIKSTTTVSSTERVDDWSKGVYGSIFYRHTKFQGALEGFFLQGGLRYSSLTASREQIIAGAGSGGGDLKVRTTGEKSSNIGPVAGVGFQFSEKISLEFNISQVKGQSADGALQKTGSALELALGIHL